MGERVTHDSGLFSSSVVGRVMVVKPQTCSLAEFDPNTNIGLRFGGTISPIHASRFIKVVEEDVIKPDIEALRMIPIVIP